MMVLATPVFGHPLGKALFITEPLLTTLYVGFQYVTQLTTVIALALYSLAPLPEASAVERPLRFDTHRAKVSVFI